MCLKNAFFFTIYKPGIGPVAVNVVSYSTYNNSISQKRA